MKLAIVLIIALSLGHTVCAAESNAHLGATSHSVSMPGKTGNVAFDHHILVDQFGYRPADPKVAVIRTPHVGFDGADTFSPGANYQVRRASDSVAVFTGKPTAWNRGSVETSSGDSGWWFDFSAVTALGTYYVFDVDKNVRSAPFQIDPQVYKNILKAAVRMYFYQRSGFAKQAPYADKCWIDSPAYVGPGQDLQARDITDRDNGSKAKDLSGGWFDAGDTNKYVTFATPAVHQLLTAYQQNTAVFTDDFNIPESGNNIPDIVDEVKWEVDWLKKMQYADGSAALKVGVLVNPRAAPPSSDASPRFYVPSCTSSTIAVAGMFAHAALVYRGISRLTQESHELETRAVAAWQNFQNRSDRQIHCDSGKVRSGNADWSAADQANEAVVAAVYLYALTGEARYRDYIAAHYRETRPYHDIGWSRYHPEEGEALLFYTSLPNAAQALKTAILADKSHDVAAGNQVYGFAENDDLYRAFMHDAQFHWGSNGIRAAYGNSNMDVLTYQLDAPSPASYRNRALEILHYLHGVNPFGMVYLTNMYAYGATVSANEIFHDWFWHDSKWSDAMTSECGPAPGYLPGGPNVYAVQNGVPASVMPPAGQPPQKSYKDWNADWPQSSWAVTEPGIYYQSAYVELLSKFAR